MVGDHRIVADQFRLADIGVHPCTAALGLARIGIEDEDRQLLAVLVEHVVGPGVRVVLGQVGAFLEADAVKLVGRVEHAVLQHVLHLQVRLELRFVEVELGLAHLFGVVSPVPGLELERRFTLGLLLAVDHRLQVGGFLPCVGHGRWRQLAEHPVDVGRRLGGFVGQHEVGPGVVAEQLGLLGAQLGHLGDDRGVVPLVAAAAARDRGLVDLLAQGAVFQLGFGRLAGGVEQGDDVLAFELAALGGFRRARDLLVGQALELFLGVDHHGRIVHFRQHVLAELGAELGGLGIDLADARLVGFG